MKSLVCGLAGALLGYLVYPRLHPHWLVQGPSTKDPQRSLLEPVPAAVAQPSTSLFVKPTSSGDSAKQETPELPAQTFRPSSSEVSPVSLDKSKISKLKSAPETLDARWMTFMQRPYLESFSGRDRRILGRFEGTLTQNDGQLDSVILSFNFRQRDQVLQGGSHVSLVDSNGKEYSRHSDSGGNRTVKSGPAENSYYIEVSPISYMVLSFKHYPQLAGSYFERGRPVGKVELRKVDP